MENPSFQSQYNKIVNAYYKNQLNPFDSCACFIGNMLNGNLRWGYGRKVTVPNKFEILKVVNDEFALSIALSCIRSEANSFYTLEEIFKLEENFLNITTNYTPVDDGITSYKYNEEDLFKAMVSTLEMLKEIHISKGEVVNNYSFTKRELV